MIPFPSKVTCSILNHVSAEPYTLVRADQLKGNSEQVAEIVATCNQPEIYFWLFSKTLNGASYSAKNAQAWLDWSNDGWQANTHFSFAVLDAKGQIVAACDIKSAEPKGAEIGYWSSVDARGIMTNAVMMMCNEARRANSKSLTARTLIDNWRSKGVLKRAGFYLDSSVKDEEFDHFALRLDN